MKPTQLAVWAGLPAAHTGFSGVEHSRLRTADLLEGIARLHFSCATEAQDPSANSLGHDLRKGMPSSGWLAPKGWAGTPCFQCYLSLRWHGTTYNVLSSPSLDWQLVPNPYLSLQALILGHDRFTSWKSVVGDGRRVLASQWVFSSHTLCSSPQGIRSVS